MSKARRLNYQSFGELVWDSKISWVPGLFFIPYCTFKLIDPGDPEWSGWLRWLWGFSLLLWLGTWWLLWKRWQLVRNFQRVQREAADYLVIKAIEIEQRMTDNYAIPSPLRDTNLSLAQTMRAVADDIRKAIAPRKR